MKRKFRFRLEAVEKVRKAQEQKALIALSQAQACYQQAVEFRNLLISDREKSIQRKENLSQTPQNILSYQLENEFLRGQEQKILQASYFIQKAKKNVDRQLREYLVSKKKLKMIEKLKENALLEFKKESVKKEQKEQEELYVTRARLNRESA